MLKKLICVCVSILLLVSVLSISYAEDYQEVDQAGITTLEVENFSAADILSVSGKKFISFNSGNTVNFEINVAKAGKYILRSDAGTTTNAKANFLLDGTLLLSAVYENTGNYNKIQTHELGIIELSEGEHTLSAVGKGGGMHFDNITLEPYQETEFSDGAYKNHVLPCVIQAEDFDYGAGGYKSVDGKNDGGGYRIETGVDIYKDGEGFFVSLGDGEFTAYTFTAEHKGVYDMYLISSEANEFDLYIDGYKYPIKCIADKKMSEPVCSVYFSQGKHNIRIMSGIDQTSAKLDYIRFATSATNEYLDPQKLNNGIYDIHSLETADNGDHPVYKEYYVSPQGSDEAQGTKEEPFATLERAKQEVRKINNDMTGDIIVNIEQGDYKLSSTLKFDASDSGKNGFDVIYRGEDKNNPSVLTGGRKVEGWEKHTDFIWKAPLEDAGEVRNLYINEMPAVRARSKYAYNNAEMYDDPETKEYFNDGFKVDKKNFIKDIVKPGDLELVWYNSWASQRTPVKDILRPEGDKIIFLMEQPYFHIACIEQSGTPCAVSENKLFYMENAMELLDEPGEFYYNSDENIIYYYPFNAEDMNSVSTYIGETEFLADIKGNSESERIENITFENLSFKYGAWNEPSQKGMFTIQATSKRAMELNPDGSTKGMLMPAQVSVQYANDINFIGCEFVCLGSEALGMTKDVNNSRVDGCIFRDLSAGGITVGNSGKTKYDGMNIAITNNVIRRVGVEFPDSLPITVYYGKNINIQHNDIRDVPYSGINAGWGWGNSDPSGWGYMTISHNYIDDVMKTLNDGGHIYVLGKMRGTQISYNYTGKGGYHVQGVYTDQGSDLMEIHHNVMDGDPGSYWWMQNIVESPKAYNNYSVSEVYNKSGKGATVKDHTYLTDDAWPQAALDIKANAGVKPEYRYLLERAEKPIDKLNRNEELPDKTYKTAEQKSWTEAENYNKGGEGIGYHDIDSHKPSLATSFYKPGEKMISDTDNGEWLKYDIKVPSDGEYTIQIRAGHGWKDTFAGCTISIDGNVVFEDFPITNTTWSKLEVFTVGKVYLTEGKHTLKYEFKGSGTYLDAFRIIDLSNNVYDSNNYSNDAEYLEGILELEGEQTEEENQNYEIISFADVKGHWAEEEINLLAEIGIIKGISKELFAPNDTVTKRQAVLLTLRALEINHTDESAVEVALEKGIISNLSNLDSTITREEYADIIMNAYMSVMNAYKITIHKEINNDFGSVNPIYANSVLGALELGIIVGDDNGNIIPKGSLTRAEAAVMTKRLINKR